MICRAERNHRLKSNIGVYMKMEKNNIGIIGGSDGPTSIYISSSGLSWYEITALVLVAAVAAGFIIRAIIKRRRRK